MAFMRGVDNLRTRLNKIESRNRASESVQLYLLSSISRLTCALEAGKQPAMIRLAKSGGYIQSLRGYFSLLPQQHVAYVAKRPSRFSLHLQLNSGRMPLCPGFRERGVFYCVINDCMRELGSFLALRDRGGSSAVRVDTVILQRHVQSLRWLTCVNSTEVPFSNTKHLWRVLLNHCHPKLLTLARCFRLLLLFPAGQLRYPDLHLAVPGPSVRLALAPPYHHHHLLLELLRLPR